MTEEQRLNRNKFRREYRVKNKLRINGQQRAHYKKNRKEIRITAKKYYEENREKMCKAAKVYRLKNKDVGVNAKLMQAFGITFVQYKELLRGQGNKCAICQCFEKRIDIRTNEVRRLAVDHNHETGKIRGLLCASCNTALGLFQDNPVLLMSAINYLNKNI